MNEHLNQILDESPVQSLSWPSLKATPRSSATTQQWVAGLVRFQAFELLPKETQTELAQIGMRTHQSKLAEATKAQYDVNRDGKLSRDESNSMLIKPDGADTNGDGLITVEEYSAWRSKNR